MQCVAFRVVLRCKTARIAVRNGPNWTAKWAVSHLGSACIARRGGAKDCATEIRWCDNRRLASILYVVCQNGG